jgi:hypothetical protein
MLRISSTTHAIVHVIVLQFNKEPSSSGLRKPWGWQPDTDWKVMACTSANKQLNCNIAANALRFCAPKQVVTMLCSEPLPANSKGPVLKGEIQTLGAPNDTGKGGKLKGCALMGSCTTGWASKIWSSVGMSLPHVATHSYEQKWGHQPDHIILKATCLCHPLSMTRDVSSARMCPPHLTVVSIAADMHLRLLARIFWRLTAFPLLETRLIHKHNVAMKLIWTYQKKLWTQRRKQQCFHASIKTTSWKTAVVPSIKIAEASMWLEKWIVEHPWTLTDVEMVADAWKASI